VILVGHQPDLGTAAAYLVSGSQAGWRIKKGGLWWVSNDKEILVRAVVSPDFL
jgi:phosphohistidine phosphatase